ncbi:MAG: S-layer homology domain-containing protein, partial [Clostridiales bacterium]|nr:S-layer homology domain-containing protein [Clostridiales bacterium]
MKRNFSSFARKTATAALTAAILLSGVPVTAATSFSDVSGHWAGAVVGRWQGKSVVVGFEDGTFRPDEPLTRAQFSSVLNKVMIFLTTGVNTFSDVSQGDWFYEPISKLNAAGILVKTDGEVRPNEALSREEAAVMTARLLSVSPSSGATTFADDRAISESAKPYIKALQERGGVSGQGNNTFNPKGTLTRAESLAFLDQNITLLLTESGVYNQNVSGTVVVNTQGATVENMTVEGDFILAPGIGAGDITLRNVTVKGRIHIFGGNVKLSGTYDDVYNHAQGLKLELSGSIKKLTSDFDLTVSGSGSVEQKIGVNGAVINIGGYSAADGLPSDWDAPSSPGSTSGNRALPTTTP